MIQKSPRIIVVIGAMKAGTTTLHDILSKHPELNCGKKTEAQIFIKASGDKERLDKKIQEIYGDTSSRDWIVDISPNYSKIDSHKEIPRWLSEYPNEKKLFFILRDPMERCRSHLAHTVKRGRWSEKDRKVWIDWVINVSLYARAIKHFERFGHALNLLDFRELTENAQKCTNRITSTVNIKAMNVSQTPHRNRSITLEKDIITLEDRKKMWSILRKDVIEIIDKYRFEPARIWLENNDKKFGA